MRNYNLRGSFKVTCAFITSVCLATGCTAWPDEGLGGMAEKAPNNYRTVEAGEQLGPEHGLRFDLELNARHLDMLVLEGGELCFPATVVQAKLRENRIRRELDGGLDYAAANDLLIQRKLLARLEQQLDYVKQHDVCTLPNTQVVQERPGDLANKISSLVNADNQFANDSFQLNPKYVGRLAEAAQLLKKGKHLTLNIVGYADDKGSVEYNQGLSLARAKKVARYLQILGIEKSRMTVSSLGEMNPLYEGTEPHEQLVNRSVSIEVTNALELGNTMNAVTVRK